MNLNTINEGKKYLAFGHMSTTLRLSFQDFWAQNLENVWINFKTNLIFGSFGASLSNKSIKKFKPKEIKKLKLFIFFWWQQEVMADVGYERDTEVDDSTIPDNLKYL